MASFPRPVGSSVQPVYNYIRGLIMTYELQQTFLFVCLVPPICGCTEAMPRCCIKLHRANLPIVPSLSFPLYAAIPAIRRPFFSPPPFPFFSFLSSPLLSFLFLSFVRINGRKGGEKEISSRHERSPIVDSERLNVFVFVGERKEIPSRLNHRGWPTRERDSTIYPSFV